MALDGTRGRPGVAHPSTVSSDLVERLVLHDLNLAARFADRIALMHNGRVAGIGAPAELLGDSMVDEVFDTQFDRRSVAGRIELNPR